MIFFALESWNNFGISILEQSPFSGEVESSEPPPPYFTSYGNADIQSQLSAKPGYEGKTLSPSSLKK